jgi:hypothetical protein
MVAVDMDFSGRTKSGGSYGCKVTFPVTRFELSHDGEHEQRAVI